jgi:GTP cyclohydrolase II
LVLGAITSDLTQISTWGEEHGIRNEKMPTLALRGDLLYCGVYARILSDLGIKKIRSVTSQPQKEMNFEKYGIELVDCVPLLVKLLKRRK